LVLGITTYEARTPENMLDEVLDIGIELVFSFDIENIKRFPAVYGKAALPSRGPPSLRGFHYFPTMRRPSSGPNRVDTSARTRCR
jgi:hypothetical protein